MAGENHAFAPVPNSTVNIVLSAASQHVQFQSGSFARHCRVVNSGTAAAFIEFGTSTVTASVTASMAILPNTDRIFSAPYPFVAAIGGTGSTLYFTPGEGGLV